MIQLVLNDFVQSGRLRLDSAQLQASLGQRASCTFKIRNDDGRFFVDQGIAVTLRDWPVVASGVFDSATFDSTPFDGAGSVTTLFSGTVEQIQYDVWYKSQYENISSVFDTQVFDGGPFDASPRWLYASEVTCTAVDNNALADRVVIASETFTGQTAGAIFTYLLNAYLLPSFAITVGLIQSGATIAKFEAKECTVAKAFDDLAAQAGFIWHIDNATNIFFHAPGERMAPFDIFDGASRFREGSLKVFRDRTQYRNEQTVKLDDGTYDGAADSAAVARYGPFASIDQAKGFTDHTAAQALAQALLTKYKYDLIKVEYETDLLGLFPGLSQRVSFPSLGVSDVFLIESTSTTIEGLDNNTCRYRTKVSLTNGIASDTFVKFFQRRLLGA